MMPDKALVYRVRNWDDLYENNRTRELRRMEWVPVLNRMDTDPYTELVAGHEAGPAHLGVWLAVLMIASRCDPRGTLLRECRSQVRESRMWVRDDRTQVRHENGPEPHTPQSLARMSHLPAGLVEEAILRLLEIGWLEEVELESVVYNTPHPSATIPHEPAEKRGGQRQHPAPSCEKTRSSRACEERNGTERNGTEERRIASVEAAEPTPAAQLPPLKNPQPKKPETETERIEWVRESLVGYVQGSRGEGWPPPDDEICRQVLAVSNGASCALIGQALVELHRKHKQPEISWAWFPEVIGAFLNPPKLKRAGEESSLLREAAQG